MRRKILQHIANTLCPMLVGWRMYEDLEILSDLPSGTIEFDLLQAEAIHSQQGKIRLQITNELQSWMLNQFKENKIEIEKIQKVSLLAYMDTDKIKTDKKSIVSFHWSVNSEIATDEKNYKGYLKEAHQWHKRLTNQ